MMDKLLIGHFKVVMLVVNLITVSNQIKVQYMMQQKNYINLEWFY